MQLTNISPSATQNNTVTSYLIAKKVKKSEVINDSDILMQLTNISPSATQNNTVTSYLIAKNVKKSEATY
jgi:hypothetical protein